MIRLQAADIALELAPAVGGSVVSLSYRGQDVLRRATGADLAAGRVLGMAAFPLVPFAGRIEHGRFEFRGRTVHLPPGLPGEAHAIHGQGWQRPWAVTAQSADTATLVFEHPGDDWPWRYRATQAFQVQPGRMRLDLVLENLGDEPMPAGLGWHPYFVRPPGTELRAAVSALWRRRPAGLPGPPEALAGANDLRAWRPVDDLDLDDVFTAAGTGTEIRWPHARARLRGRPAPFLVIYTPPAEPWFCAEPVSHVPNGANLPDRPATGWRALAPRALQALRVDLELSAGS